MKIITAILLFATLTFLPWTAFGQSGKSVSVQIHTEKKVANAGIRIKFVEMVEDSRCPTGTTCIWAGSAKVKIEVRNGRGPAQTFELNTGISPSVAKFGGYDIRLMGLTPKPAVNIRINRNGYVATFEVAKTKK